MKVGISTDGDFFAEYYEATVVSANDYYPFGSAMAGRKYNQGSYRFGFNGKEEDSEWGSQMIQDYGFRIYNPTIGKFLSVDPLSSSYPWYTPYQFAGNKVIVAIDLDGLEEAISILPENMEMYWDLYKESKKGKALLARIESPESGVYLIVCSYLTDLGGEQRAYPTQSVCGLIAELDAGVYNDFINSNAEGEALIRKAGDEGASVILVGINQKYAAKEDMITEKRVTSYIKRAHKHYAEGSESGAKVHLTSAFSAKFPYLKFGLQVIFHEFNHVKTTLNELEKNPDITKAELGEIWGAHGINDHHCYEWGLCNGESAPTTNEKYEEKGYSTGVISGTEEEEDYGVIQKLYIDAFKNYINKVKQTKPQSQSMPQSKPDSGN